MLASLVIDLASIGAHEISRECGLTSPDTAVDEIKAQPVRGTKRRVLAGVHAQFRSTVHSTALAPGWPGTPAQSDWISNMPLLAVEASLG
ncbi:hypothetical protein QFZ82_000045 [Streptomyces sp. V4I23]|nr:hypothetical protein [Streptomyces sp. V4I23]